MVHGPRLIRAGACYRHRRRVPVKVTILLTLLILVLAVNRQFHGDHFLFSPPFIHLNPPVFAHCRCLHFFPFPISTIRLILQCDPCEFEPLLSASTCATWLHGVQLPRLIVVTPASLLQPCPDSMASQLGVNTNSHLVLLPPPHPPRTISPAALQHHPYPHAGQIYCCQTPVTPPCLPAVTPDSLPNLPHLPHLPHPCHTYGSSATHYHTTCLQPLSPR